MPRLTMEFAKVYFLVIYNQLHDGEAFKVADWNERVSWVPENSYGP